MITSLKLKSFQAHKSSELVFGPGVNAIIGESDEGKTSIIRALKELSDNKASGTSYISDFTKKGEYSIEAEIDNQIVERVLEFHTDKKGDKVIDRNAYWINDQEFLALGKAGVPDEVSNLLQLSELNFQNQMDSPFLLSNNGGEVARYLNKVANLDIISSSLTKGKTKVTDCNTEIKRTEGSIVTKKAELAEMDWVDLADKELVQLDDEIKNFEWYSEIQKLLTETLNDIDDLLEDLDKFKERDDELYQISLLVKEWESWDGGINQLDSFTSDLNGLKTISSQIDSLPFDKKEIESLTVLQVLIDSFLPEEKRLNELLVLLDNTYDIQEGIAELNSDAEIKDFNELDNSVSAYQIEKDLVLELDHLLGDIEDYKKQKELCIESIQSLEIKFKKEFPAKCDSDSCPLMEA